MSISENIKPLISNTYYQKNRIWKWIDGEWLFVVNTSKEEVLNVEKNYN